VLAWASALSRKAAPVTLTLGVAGFVLLLVVLWRGHLDLLGTSLLLLGAAYVLGLLAGHHVLDQGAPLVAGGLLACGELASWSLEQRPRVPAAEPLVRARATAVGVLVLAGTGAAALVLAVAAAPVGSGIAWTLLGALAAVGAIAVAARLAASR
jgi:hypothetical protein